MKHLLFFLFALLLCVSCQQTPSVMTGIELKTGTRYYVEKGTPEAEMAPAILVKYSDGSRVEAVGSVSSTESGFADITYQDFRIENGAYIYDVALSEFPATMGADYSSKYVLLKAKEDGYKIDKDTYTGRSEAVSVTAEGLYILGEDGAEIVTLIKNNTTVFKVTDGSVTFDGIKFTTVEPDETRDKEVNLIVAEGGKVSVRNCDFTGYKVDSLNDLSTQTDTAQISISSNEGGSLSLTDNVFREMYVFTYSQAGSVFKNNVFKNAYIVLLSPGNVVEDNLFDNTSIEYEILYTTNAALDDEAIAEIEAKNNDCRVIPFNDIH